MVDMKALKEFIIQIEKPFSDTIETKGGLKIYGDKRFSAERLSNRIGKVISTPIETETNIQVGFEVLIDPTILFEQVYHLTGGRQDSVFLVDKKKMYYKVDPRLVVLFRENNRAEWKGYLNNAIYQSVVDDKAPLPLESAFIHIVENNLTQHKPNRAKLLYGNETILKEVNVGQELIVKEEMGIPFYIDGETCLWYRNEDVIAAVN